MRRCRPEPNLNFPHKHHSSKFKVWRIHANAVKQLLCRTEALQKTDIKNLFPSVNNFKNHWNCQKKKWKRQIIRMACCEQNEKESWRYQWLASAVQRSFHVKDPITRLLPNPISLPSFRRISNRGCSLNDSRWTARIIVTSIDSSSAKLSPLQWPRDWLNTISKVRLIGCEITNS